MVTTVTSDAEFKTYVEGLTAFTTDTVYMNDDSKYWTFTRENNGKINAMCVTSTNVELWMFDGTDWVINRVPSVVNNLTSTSTSDALSAKQGKVLDEKIDTLDEKVESYHFVHHNGSAAGNGGTYSFPVTVASGQTYLIYGKKNTTDTSGTASLYCIVFTSDNNMAVSALYEGANAKLEFAVSNGRIVVTNRATAYMFISVLATRG